MKKLGFGLMRLPLVDGKVDIETTNKMVDEFMKHGFTYFDTAWPYLDKQSESAVKTCIVDRYLRDKFTITTKFPHSTITSLEERDEIFNEQKRKTGCTYFDYYWLHNVNARSLKNTFDKYDCWNFIIDKKNKGEIKHIGFSYHDGPELLDEILNKHPEMEYVQLQLNYLDFESTSVQSRKCYEVCVKHGKKVMVMEPVKGGTLVNIPQEASELFKALDPKMSIPSWAIRFAASLENVEVVLSGMSNYEQVLDNTNYMDNFIPLNEEEKKACLKVAEIINKNITVPCTGCKYCMEKCPINMPIPTLFSLYNADKQEVKDKGWTPQIAYYENLCASGTKPSDCLKCGACETMCPQRIAIRDTLEDIDKYFKEK